MPIVMRIGGLRVVIWPNDHQPAHVHVKGPEEEAVFELNCPEGPVTLRDSYRFRLAELNRVEAVLSPVVAALCADWRVIHGDH